MRDIVLVKLLLSSDSRSFVASRNVTADPFCAEKTVPEGEEWLAEVGLDAPALVVNVVVTGVVAGNVLERIPRKSVTAVIIDSLDSAASKEPHGLSASHTSEHVGNTSTQCVKKEALEGVVVQSAISVRDVKTVVTRVESCVEPLVHVHGSVQEVLPCVDNEDSEGELQGGDSNPVDGLCKCELPRSKRRDKVTCGGLLVEIVATALQGSRESWMGNGVLGCNGASVETSKGEHSGDCSLSDANPLSPGSDIVIVLANGGLGFNDCYGKTNGCLNDLLNYYVAEDIPS